MGEKVANALERLSEVQCEVLDVLFEKLKHLLLRTLVRGEHKS
jgi:hypothetical protein